MYDIIIIGAGPAGLSAAIYALRANKKILILEKSNYGGRIVNAGKIENYPGIPSIDGFSFASNLYKQVKDLGGKITFEEVLKITKDRQVITNKSTYNAKAIIIATGTKEKKLNLARENKLIGKGISYCATCDANFFKGEDVAVVGGGNTALEDALYLSNVVREVYLIHRRDTFRGEDRYVEEIKNKDNIKIIYNSTITKINGENALESIEVTGKDNNSKIIKIQGLFIAIGSITTTKIFSDIIDLTSDGSIATLDGVHTNISGIYTAGDVREHSIRQLSAATADGTVAATVAIKEML